MAICSISRSLSVSSNTIRLFIAHKYNIYNHKVFARQSRYFSVTARNKMKFVQFKYKNSNDLRVGFVKGDGVVDLQKADSSLPSSLLGILQNGLAEKSKTLAKSGGTVVPWSDVRLEAPITGMDKVICVGLNYRDHCIEQNKEIPTVPMFFSKWSSCITSPEDPVQLRTKVTKCVDWEVELTLVIGKKASNVKAEDAFNYILGYTVAQDMSARDWQKNRNGGQFLLGKAMDTFCPLGPWIVTSDEVADPGKLDIKCSVNNVLKQTSNTSQLIQDIPSIIARLTSVMTLLPGDIILTGTPGGVGMYRDPPEYLKQGDEITSEIESIGVLKTKIVHV